MPMLQPEPQLASDPRTAEILDIVAKETQIDRARLTPEASIEALGIPSLDMVQVIFEIEARYDVEIPVAPERAGGEFSTIGDLVAHALRAIDAARAAEPRIGGATDTARG
ncbi:acyl carrier protein [Lichenicoccus sp.]|uniref:acyl carrier protein n=1 Tax=Lichenicoccus sp. TaxID=2781899 RepID=UPI003D137577